MEDTGAAEQALAKAEHAHATISRLVLKVTEGEKKARVESRLLELSNRLDTHAWRYCEVQSEGLVLAISLYARSLPLRRILNHL